MEGRRRKRGENRYDARARRVHRGRRRQSERGRRYRSEGGRHGPGGNRGHRRRAAPGAGTGTSLRVAVRGGRRRRVPGHLMDSAGARMMGHRGARAGLPVRTARQMPRGAGSGREPDGQREQRDESGPRGTHEASNLGTGRRPGQPRGDPVGVGVPSRGRSRMRHTNRFAGHAQARRRRGGIGIWQDRPFPTGRGSRSPSEPPRYVPPSSYQAGRGGSGRLHGIVPIVVPFSALSDTASRAAHRAATAS